MVENGGVGSKRPLGQNGSEFPRKRAVADADEDLIEQQFDLEEENDDEELIASFEEVEDTLGEAGKNWQRPAPPPIDPSKDRVVFQQLEVDYFSGAPNQKHYPSDLQEVPILRMFGVNELGKSTHPLFSYQR